MGTKSIRITIGLLVLAFAALSGTAFGQGIIDGCGILPPDNIWNAPVDRLPVDARSDDYVATIGIDAEVHADFGSGFWPPESTSPIGIPFVTVPGRQPRVPVTFDYADESDPGPYPIPHDPPIEGGTEGDGDRHILVIDRARCLLYELFDAHPEEGGGWSAGSGAVFNLKSNALRPDGWTSADAAGLPILPGLVRYDEVASGEIRHALRFTAPSTRRAYVWPARHYASSLTGLAYPPMGQRFRLKADFKDEGFSPEVRVILRALKRYGMILADNGSSWYLSGVPDERWDNGVLHELDVVRGSDFEAVDVSSLMLSPDSGRARPRMRARVRATDPGAAEGRAGRGAFRLSRTGDLTDPLTVRYTVSGTAENGTDFALLPGIVRIPAGEAGVNIFVIPVNDAEKEESETVTLTIDRDPLYIVGTPSNATVTIAASD